MRAIRPAVTAVLILMLMAATAAAQCVSGVATVRFANATPQLQPGPSAWSGNALGVASTEGPSKAIWFTLYSESGAELRAPVRIAASSQRGPMALLWNGSEFGLFYLAGQMLMLGRISSDGVVGAVVPVLPGLFTAPSDEMAFAWSTAHDAYAIARSTASGLRSTNAYIVNRDGTTRREVQLSVTGTTRPHLRIAVTDAGVIGVFYGSGDRIMHARIDDRPDAVIHDFWDAGDDLVVAAHDNRFVVARTFRTAPDKTEIRWLVVDSSGQIVKPAAVLVKAPGVDVAPVALMSRDGELALTYLESFRGFPIEPASYRLLRFNTAGTIISDTLFAAAAPLWHRAQSAHAAVWTGSAYVNVVTQPSVANAAVNLLRICPLTVRVVGPRHAALGKPVVLSASVDGGVPGYTYHWSLGDRSFSAAPSVVHTYPWPADFEVTLTVTDQAGMQTTDTMTVSVFKPKRRAVRQ